MGKAKGMNSNKSLNYYDRNAKDFVHKTQNVDFKESQDRFLDKLFNGSRILDFGCGSGRDTKYFLEKGYLVEAIDGSAEMCKIASDFSGIEVLNINFLDFEEINKYDAIFACASLLHLTTKELIIVIDKLFTSLKNNGVLNASFKYGTYEGFRHERYFNDMTEEKFFEIPNILEKFKREDVWISNDVCPGREEEKWLNLILRKIN